VLQFGLAENTGWEGSVKQFGSISTPMSPSEYNHCVNFGQKADFWLKNNLKN